MTTTTTTTATTATTKQPTPVNVCEAAWVGCVK